MRVYLFLSFLSFGIASFAQEFPVNWGPLEKGNGILVNILPKNQLEFNTLRWVGGNAIGSYKLMNYENFIIASKQKIKLVGETGICNFLDAFNFGKNTLVFLSDKVGDRMVLYVQYYDEGLNWVSTEFVAEYENNKFDAQPNFEVIPSPQQKYLAVIWQTEGKGIDNDRYGYKIFGDSLQMIQGGEYSIPFDGNLSTINGHHISDKGDYFICVTEHNKANDKLFTKSFNNFKAMHVFKTSKDTLKEFSIDLQGKRVEDLQMSSNEQGTFTLTGIYGTSNKNGIEGIFTIHIDPTNESSNGESMIPFGKEIAQEAWSIRQQDRSNSFNTNNTDPFYTNQNFQSMNNRDMMANPLYDYRMRNFYTLEDGSIIGSLEQYYVFQRTTYDYRTSFSSTMNYYYYDDIIAFRLSKTGNLIWQTRIPKSQVSMNDYGEFSSYCGFLSEHSLNFIFNDHAKNYDENGLFAKNPGNFYSFNLTKKNNAVSLTRVDLETGEVIREMMDSRKDLESIIVPKQFRVDQLTKEILMYSISGQQERFGVLTFK